MYTITSLVTILERGRTTLFYHVKKGHLKATKDSSGNFQVTQADLDDFRMNYLYADKKRENIVYNSGKKLNLESFTKLTEFVEFVKSTDSVEEVISKYSKLELKIPSLEAFVLHERNNQLVSDYEDGMNLSDLVKKYKLSKSRVCVILRNNREF